MRSTVASLHWLAKNAQLPCCKYWFNCYDLLRNDHGTWANLPDPELCSDLKQIEWVWVLVDTNHVNVVQLAWWQQLSCIPHEQEYEGNEWCTLLSLPDTAVNNTKTLYNASCSNKWLELRAVLAACNTCSKLSSCCGSKLGLHKEIICEKSLSTLDLHSYKQCSVTTSWQGVESTSVNALWPWDNVLIIVSLIERALPVNLLFLSEREWVCT